MIQKPELHKMIKNHNNKNEQRFQQNICMQEMYPKHTHTGETKDKDEKNGASLFLGLNVIKFRVFV